MKICSKCKINKHFSEFYQCNKSKDSLNYKCKYCVKKYQSKYSKSHNKNLRSLGKCVYLHKNPKTNEVFYVGIGTEKRPFEFNKRSLFWRNYYLKHGVKVCIIENGLSIKEAYVKEIKLISLYGRRDLNKGSLVNLTNGGEGSVENRKHEDSKRCICLINGVIYSSIMSYCKENKLSYNAVVQFLKTTEQSKIEYRNKPYNVRLLRKDNTIVWDYSEKLNINLEYYDLDS